MSEYHMIAIYKEGTEHCIDMQSVSKIPELGEQIVVNEGSTKQAVIMEVARTIGSKVYVKHVELSDIFPPTPVCNYKGM